MSDEHELRATSDLMLQMVERLHAAEVEKRQHVPGTEDFGRLAYDVLELSRTVTRWAELQLRQANEIHADGPEPRAAALQDVPLRKLDEVLAEWRQAEIRLSQLPPGSPEADAATSEVARLKQEYRVLQDRKHDGRRD